VTDARDRIRQLGAAAGGIAVILPLAIVLLSAGLSPASNWTVRAALAGFCLLAVSRPADALLAATALVGFGIILSHLAGVPLLRVTEVLLLASIAGCCIRALPRDTPFRRALTGSCSVPIAVYAIAAVAATIVWLRLYQVQAGDAASYAGAFLHFVRYDYFTEPGEFWDVVSMAVILEGLALYVIVAALCRVDATFFDRGLRMLALGGAGLAALSVVRLAEIMLRNPQAVAALRASYAGLRISPQIPDYIAAGSYFALCWLVALGLAIGSSRRRWVWVAGGVPLIAGLYLTGSRSVIAAALAGLVVLVFIVIRRRAAAGRGVIRFAVAAVIVMVISFPWIIGHDVVGETAKQSLTVRVELVRAGLRVIETRPLFGVGIDRFYLVAGGFASPALNALWNGRKNPHNDFLRVGAELGLVGLGLLLWILGAAGRRIWQALRRTRDARLAGVTAGLVAFLITSFVSNPLMVREVSYVFWIALGLAVGHSTAPQVPSDVPDLARSDAGVRSRRARRWRRTIGLVLGASLLISVPFRVRQELADIDLTRVSYGLLDWGTEPDGTRSRWTGPQATIFVDGRARVVEIPLKGTLPSGVPQRVEAQLDGRVANRIAAGSDWQRLRIVIPIGSANTPHRIDLHVVPSWVPAEVIPGNQDMRVLGVRMGEINVVLNPGQVR
jgi:O-antigen ligase